ncbi:MULTISPECIES: hypothetical protein [Nocardia]|uniref:hypothetical protein n=1 Tax=Nocardia TaxID=1817 RepID=UPI00135C8AA9|nr:MULTISPECIES: hypothetical protein [Nocardia]
MPKEFDFTELLARLPKSEQQRVSALLKSTIERELIATAGKGLSPGDAGANFDKQHDRGPFFGKDFDKQSSDVEDMKRIAQLGEDEFQKFAERLSVLRDKTPGGQ